MAGRSLQPLRAEGEGATWYAYAYLTLLLLAPVVGAVVAVYTGLLDVQATVTVAPDLSTPLEWLSKGLVAVFLLWTFVQVVRVTGIGFIRGLVSALARIADSYELPGEPPEEGEGGGGG